MCSLYDEDTVGGEKRSVLRFHPSIAPIKVPSPPDAFPMPLRSELGTTHCFSREQLDF